MKVAAYQVPLDAIYSFEVVSLIRQQISWCEQNGVEILCCPEAVLGGLADYVDGPSNVALEVGNGQLARLLEPLSSQTVTTIVGFTETYGARLFIPTNNGMPIHRATTNLVEEARRVDIQRARENRVYVVRADVAGQDKNLLSYGSSSVIDPHGRVLGTESKLAAQVVVANIETMPE